MWEPYITIATKWDARAFIDQLAPILCSIGNDAEVQVNFVTRLAEASAQAISSRDRFREIEVRAACAVAMLPYARHHIVDTYLAAAGADVGDMVQEAVKGITQDLGGYQYGLVTGGWEICSICQYDC